MSYYNRPIITPRLNGLCVTVQGVEHAVCMVNPKVSTGYYDQIFMPPKKLRHVVRDGNHAVFVRIGNHGFRITACHSDPKRYAAILAASTPAKLSDASGTSH